MSIKCCLKKVTNDIRRNSGFKVVYNFYSEVKTQAPCGKLNDQLACLSFKNLVLHT